MAGFAAYIKIDGFNILPVLSISMAATTFAGQNIGAGKADRVRKGMYISTAMGAGYSECGGKFETIPGLSDDRGNFEHILGSDHGCRIKTRNCGCCTGYGYQSADFVHFYMGISDPE